MAERTVRLWPDPVLTQTCAPADLADPDLGALIDDLFDTMYAAKGRGLAAPQLGVLQRVFVVDVSWKEGIRDPRIFINPRVVDATGDDVTMDEQCLSIPDLPMPVTRPERVHLKYTTPDGSTVSSVFEGALARCIQHEFDHLDGTVIFDHQPANSRAEFEDRYAP